MATLTGEQRSDIYRLLNHIEMSHDEVYMLVGDRADLQRVVNEAHELQEVVNRLVQRLEEISS